MLIKINRNPYAEKPLYTKASIELNPGLTVLVGCNGSGKTTLLKMLEKTLVDDGKIVVKYDNRFDGGSNARAEAAARQNYETLSAAWSASEGEEININLGTFASRVGRAVRNASTLKENREAFVLLDAIDSGLSVDNIVEFKEFLTQCVFPDAAEHNVTVYVVASANEYELCRGEQCLDVKHCKYITFDNYEEYRRFILDSRALKDKRR